MALLTSADWPEVRALINPALESTSLPDATIALPTYHGEAEEEVLDRVGQVEADLDATELIHAKKAAKYLLAAMLAEVITVLPFFGSNGDFDRVTFNGAARAERLRQMAQDEISEITSPSDDLTANTPTFFGLASGTRGF